jgi:hypothetical protein
MHHLVLMSAKPSFRSHKFCKNRRKEWINKRILGIGPRFPKEWTRDVVAADFKNGIAQMISAGQLSMTSPFVQSINSSLDLLIAAQGACVPLDAVLAIAFQRTGKKHRQCNCR